MQRFASSSIHFSGRDPHPGEAFRVFAGARVIFLGYANAYGVYLLYSRTQNRVSFAVLHMNQRNTALKSHARNASAASAALFGHPILRTRLGEVLVFGGPKGHCREAEHGNRPRVHVGTHGPRVPPRAGVLEPRCYAIVRMAVVDWRHIGEVAPRFVRDAVVCTGLDAGRYLELAGGVSLSKTHGRRALGCFDDLSCMFDPARIDMREKLRRRATELLNLGSYRSVPDMTVMASPSSASGRICRSWPSDCGGFCQAGICSRDD